MRSSKKIISVLSVALFFIWILPLGAFIKANQEKEACAGQRAICLCSHLLVKQAKKNTAALVQTAAASQKESSGGASHQFLAIDPADILNRQTDRFSHQLAFIYHSPILGISEAVPKA